MTVWLLVRATCSWWVSESPLTPRGWEAVIGWEPLHSHLALIKQCQSVFINCRLLFVKWLFWPFVQMAILETWIESGFCNVSVELWSSRGGRSGHGQWTDGTTFDAPVALALSSLLLLLSEPAWTGGPPTHLIEMSVDWEKVNERLPYKKGEEGQLILQHLCVTKCFCETPIIVARTSAEEVQIDTKRYSRTRVEHSKAWPGEVLVDTEGLHHKTTMEKWSKNQ